MRIAQITSVYLPVPPPTHGGTEIVVHRLCEELTRRGHDVHLFASGDSNVSGTLHSVVERATLGDPDITVYVDKEMEARNTLELYRDADGFDVIHAHWPTLAPYFASLTHTPTVLTYAYIEPWLHRYYREHFPGICPVCVSRRQAELLGEPDLPVVYNGIDVASAPFCAEPDDYLILVARMVPNKGVAAAIGIAERARERLVLVGAVTPYVPWSRAYFEQRVLPHVDNDQIVHIPEAPNAEVMRLVSRAKGFLFPLEWEEPFGLAVIEAMASGTPVITYPKGAMPEIVEDGESGFLVRDEDEAVDAIGRLGTLDRWAARAWVESRFTHERMVDGYEAVYAQVVQRGPVEQSRFKPLHG